jgi:Protein of unknown function (DUF3014)
MDKKMPFAIAIVVLLGAGIAYVLLQRPHPETVPAGNPPAAVSPAPSAPAAPQIGETLPAQPPLPPLAKSDSFVFDALAGLIESESLMRFLHREKIIHNIVATIDRLPEQHVPATVMPLKPPSGRFLVAGSEGRLTISPKNAERYAAYVMIAEAIDARKLVSLYVHLYPLFQQAYKDLGYPNSNFNDQLNDTLDDLLDTPDLAEPIKLVRPKYFYLYADPEIEGSSIGQKIMLRLGSRNLKIVRSKLNEIKRELSLQMPQM